jgi:hypothetical protein
MLTTGLAAVDGAIVRLAAGMHRPLVRDVLVRALAALPLALPLVLRQRRRRRPGQEQQRERHSLRLHRPRTT